MKGFGGNFWGSRISPFYCNVTLRILWDLRDAGDEGDALSFSFPIFQILHCINV